MKITKLGKCFPQKAEFPLIQKSSSTSSALPRSGVVPATLWRGMISSKRESYPEVVTHARHLFLFLKMKESVSQTDLNSQTLSRSLLEKIDTLSKGKLGLELP